MGYRARVLAPLHLHSSPYPQFLFSRFAFPKAAACWTGFPAPARSCIIAGMTGSPYSTPSPADSSPRANLPAYTVSELSAALRRSIEERFSYVRVRGEISGFKRHSSGHCYFALKDTDAVLDAVCWRGTALRLSVKPEDGMEVVCTG